MKIDTNAVVTPVDVAKVAALLAGADRLLNEVELTEKAIALIQCAEANLANLTLPSEE